MNEILIILALVLIGLSYYVLFKEHHKRNEMTFSEIYPLVIEYYVISIISILLLILGISSVINGYINHDEVKEVIKELASGLFIISLVILHFIFWVKKHKIDLNISERQEEEVKTSNIAEWIELIAFVTVIIVSIFNIFKYIQFIDKVEKYKQISISILCIVSAVILIFNMNPLKIIDKIKEKFKNQSGKRS